MLKQAVGEPARGGSQIGTHSTRHGDLKMIQRTLKLAACSAGKLNLMQHAYCGLCIHLLAGLFNLLLIDQNPARQQQRLGLVPALGDSPLYQ